MRVCLRSFTYSLPPQLVYADLVRSQRRHRRLCHQGVLQECAPQVPGWRQGVAVYGLSQVWGNHQGSGAEGQADLQGACACAEDRSVGAIVRDSWAGLTFVWLLCSLSLSVPPLCSSLLGLEYSSLKNTLTRTLPGTRCLRHPPEEVTGRRRVQQVGEARWHARRRDGDHPDAAD